MGKIPQWTGVVIHMTMGPDTEKLESKSIKAYHLSKSWLDIGYHVVVEDVSGEQWPVGGRPLNMPGAHTKNYNQRYLGVALAGDFTTKPPSEAQLACAARTIAGLMDILAMPVEGALFRHCDLSNTTCPGAAFPWERFKLMVAKARRT